MSYSSARHVVLRDNKNIVIEDNLPTKNKSIDDENDNHDDEDDSYNKYKTWKSCNQFLKKFDDLKTRQSWFKRFLTFVFTIFLFGVLLWDMKKVQQMSILIHDDHSDLWYQMNDSYLEQWFNPVDICMIKMNDTSSVKSYRLNNCTKNSDKKQKKKLSKHLFCNIGSALGKECSTPLSEKSFFSMGLKKNGLDNPNNGNLRKALIRFAKSKTPLVFLGDAISKENQEALVCEILRTDRVYITGSFEDDISKASVSTNFTINWHDSRLSLLIVFMHMTHMTKFSEISYSEGAESLISAHNSVIEKKSEFQLLERKRNLRIPLSDSKVKIKDNKKKTSENTNLITNYTKISAKYYSKLINKSNKTQENYDETNYFGRRTSSMTLVEAKEQIESLENKYNGIVLIANVGVWYNSRERYRNDLPSLLTWLNEIGINNLVFFRETSRQHWNHTNIGYYTYPDGDMSLLGTCAPLVDSTPEYDWRNRDMKIYIRKEKLFNINIMPFTDATAPLHDMHPNFPTEQDCTRFCYFPQMWQQVWYGLEIKSRNITKDNIRDI